MIYCAIIFRVLSYFFRHKALSMCCHGRKRNDYHSISHQHQLDVRQIIEAEHLEQVLNNQ